MITLRDYQGASIEALRENFRRIKRQLLVLPTGAGKTVIFSEMARRAAQRGTQVLILTDRIELFGQTFKHLAGHSLAPQRIDADSRIFSPDAPLSVGMVETVNNRRKRGKMAGYAPKLIVCDEAHKASFFKIIDAFPEALVIGCTATPTHKKLHLYYSDIVAVIDTPELIERGYLARCRAFQMQDDFSDVPVVRGEFEEKKLFAHFNKPRIYSGFIDKWKATCPSAKTLVFCVNIRHAEATCAEIRAAGIAAEVVTSKTPSEERRRILAAHAAGLFPILVNCGILTTGYDDPSLQCVSVLRATMSLSLWLQMAGRGGRIYPGKEEFFLLDFGMNHTRHGLWHEPREWTLEPPAARKKKKGAAPIKACPKCTAMLHASAMTCEFCGHKFDKKSAEIKEGVLVEVGANTPPEIKGRRISELTIPELITLQSVKRFSKPFVWRVIRARGEAAVNAYADAMKYKTEWIQKQLGEAPALVRDFVVT